MVRLHAGGWVATYRRGSMEQVSRSRAVSTVKPYAIRFAKIHLALTLVATIGMIAFGVWAMPDLVFDWFLGPVYAATSFKIMLTSTNIAAGSVAIFAAGIAYERYR